MRQKDEEKGGEEKMRQRETSLVLRRAVETGDGVISLAFPGELNEAVELQQRPVEAGQRQRAWQSARVPGKDGVP